MKLNIPPKYKKNPRKWKVLSIRTSETEHKLYKSICKENDLSSSDLLKLMIRLFINEYGNHGDKEIINFLTEEEIWQYRNWFTKGDSLEKSTEPRSHEQYKEIMNKFKL